MLSGIGLLIIFKQIPHAFGWDADPAGDFAFFQADGETTFSEIFRALENIEPSALLVSSIALGILLFWERVLTPRGGLFRLLQGPLVAVGFGISFQLFALHFAPGWALSADHLVSVPVPQDFSELTALFAGPDWSQLGNPAVYTTGALNCVVANDTTWARLAPPDSASSATTARPHPAGRSARRIRDTAHDISGLIPRASIVRLPFPGCGTRLRWEVLHESMPTPTCHTAANHNPTGRGQTQANRKFGVPLLAGDGAGPLAAVRRWLHRRCGVDLPEECGLPIIPGSRNPGSSLSFEPRSQAVEETNDGKQVG
jgi:hypothetical protein